MWLCSSWLTGVHSSELSEGFDTDTGSQRSVAVAAHASFPLAVPAHSSRELGLALAVAAQRGMVKRALNKWWSHAAITCSLAEKLRSVSSCIPNPFPLKVSWSFKPAFLDSPCLFFFYSHPSFIFASAELNPHPAILSYPTSSSFCFWILDGCFSAPLAALTGCTLTQNMWSVLREYTHPISSWSSQQRIQ